MFDKLLRFIAVSIASLSMLVPSVPTFSGADGRFVFSIGEGASAGDFVVIGDNKMSDYYKLRDVTAETVCGVDKEYVEKFLQDNSAAFLFEERCDESVSKYYYSDKIPVYKSINGQKVNIHVAKTGERYSIGSPMIFYGY